MVAAENGALPGGKVGGIGDVIRDLPAALAERGWEVGVLTPAYGLFADLPGAASRGAVQAEFGGGSHSVGCYEVPGTHPRVRHFVLDHPRFAPHGPGHIYWDDATEGPYYSDASKFAFFCAAAAAYVVEADVKPDVLHLHDWHTALMLVLRRFCPRRAALKSVRTVFSIHNLAYQGVRPLDQTDSSLGAWFPGLRYAPEAVVDPRYRDCVNPMAAGVRLADKVNTVSPTYAREIVAPASSGSGANGGEGLEADLRRAADEGRLVGILNGCRYPEARVAPPGWRSVLEAVRAELPAWIARAPNVASVHYLAERRLARLSDARPPVVLTNVGRAVPQKVQLFRERTARGRSALEEILDLLGDDGLFVMLGSGDAEYEAFFAEIAARYDNYLFLRGFSDTLAEMLYAAGDLFLMPSSFEPCGISQMLAMRAGQPCVVHAVGGLLDTVDETCGFVFDGSEPRVQAEQFVDAVTRALEIKRGDPARWARLREAAAGRRFTWDASAARYERELYATESAALRIRKA